MSVHIASVVGPHAASAARESRNYLDLSMYELEKVPGVVGLVLNNTEITELSSSLALLILSM
jgi:hypothetical protein